MAKVKVGTNSTFVKRKKVPTNNIGRVAEILEILEYT